MSRITYITSKLPRFDRILGPADLLDKTDERGDRLQGKYVLIGTSAPGLQDIRTTPVEPQMPGVEVSDEAHRDEHSLEVQLPFLQTVLDDFTLIPIVVGGADAATVAAVVDTFGDDPATLVVISSDLSHFHAYDDARQIDAHTCEQILARATTLRGEEACGARAINGLMASRFARARKVSLIHACNSGDTAGSRDRVVGYAAFALH